MKVSAKTDYACRALLELALRWPSSTPLRVNDIAEHQKIPMKFLIHILIHLKQLGFVESIRGKKGGYMLVKVPKEIRLSDIVRSFEQKNPSNQIGLNARHKTDVVGSLWREADKVLAKFMEGVTFEDICQLQRRLEDIPMFAI